MANFRRTLGIFSARLADIMELWQDIRTHQRTANLAQLMETHADGDFLRKKKRPVFGWNN